MGISQAKIDTLSAWWEVRLYSAAERAALTNTESLTRINDTTVDLLFQSYHEQLAEHFDEDEILDIIGIVITMNIWTRQKHAEGAMPEP